MKHRLMELLGSSTLDDQATRFARAFLEDKNTVTTDRVEVERQHFLRVYSIRAEHLACMGAMTWNFSEMLEAVKANDGDSVALVLLEHPVMKILVVATEDDDLLGCSAFSLVKNEEAEN